MFAKHQREWQSVKEIMDKYFAFAQNEVAEIVLADIINIAIFRKEDKNDDRGVELFNTEKKPERVFGNSLLRMALECLYFWARNTQATIDEFREAYEYIVQQDVKFPSKINYFKPENYTAEPFIANTGEEARSTEKKQSSKITHSDQKNAPNLSHRQNHEYFMSQQKSQVQPLQQSNPRVYDQELSSALQQSQALRNSIKYILENFFDGGLLNALQETVSSMQVFAEQSEKLLEQLYHSYANRSDSPPEEYQQLIEEYNFAYEFLQDYSGVLQGLVLQRDFVNKYTNFQSLEPSLQNESQPNSIRQLTQQQQQQQLQKQSLSTNYNNNRDASGYIFANDYSQAGPYQQAVNTIQNTREREENFQSNDHLSQDSNLMPGEARVLTEGNRQESWQAERNFAMNNNNSKHQRPPIFQEQAARYEQARQELSAASQESQGDPNGNAAKVSREEYEELSAQYEYRIKQLEKESLDAKQQALYAQEEQRRLQETLHALQKAHTTASAELEDKHREAVKRALDWQDRFNRIQAESAQRTGEPLARLKELEACYQESERQRTELQTQYKQLAARLEEKHNDHFQQTSTLQLLTQRQETEIIALKNETARLKTELASQKVEFRMTARQLEKANEELQLQKLYREEAQAREQTFEQTIAELREQLQKQQLSVKTAPETNTQPQQISTVEAVVEQQNAPPKRDSLFHQHVPFVEGGLSRVQQLRLRSTSPRIFDRLPPNNDGLTDNMSPQVLPLGSKPISVAAVESFLPSTVFASIGAEKSSAFGTISSHQNSPQARRGREPIFQNNNNSATKDETRTSDQKSAKRRNIFEQESTREAAVRQFSLDSNTTFRQAQPETGPQNSNSQVINFKENQSLLMALNSQQEIKNQTSAVVDSESQALRVNATAFKNEALFKIDANLFSHVYESTNKVNRFKACCVKDKYLLYEDEVLQIGSVTQLLKPGVLQLTLYYQNKQQALLEDVRLEVLNVDAQTLKIDIQPELFPSLSPGTQYRQTITVEVLKIPYQILLAQLTLKNFAPLLLPLPTTFNKFWTAVDARSIDLFAAQAELTYRRAVTVERTQNKLLRSELEVRKYFAHAQQRRGDTKTFAVQLSANLFAQTAIQPQLRLILQITLATDGSVRFELASKDQDATLQAFILNTLYFLFIAYSTTRETFVE